MTDEEMRIVIAEACGWKIEPHSQGRRLIHPNGHIVNEHYAEPWRLPDYPNDLNAMHEAEKTLELSGVDTIQDKLNAYAETLGRISRKAGNHYIFQATARQRAEAFLRTVGKWKGVNP